MVHEIIAALSDARDDDEVRAVIVTGAGRGFCSGGDISRDFQYPARYRGHRMEAMLEMRENMHQLVTMLRRFDKRHRGCECAAVAEYHPALCCYFELAAEREAWRHESEVALVPSEARPIFSQIYGAGHALRMSLSPGLSRRQSHGARSVTEVVPDEN